MSLRGGIRSLVRSGLLIAGLCGCANPSGSSVTSVTIGFNLPSGHPVESLAAEVVPQGVSSIRIRVAAGGETLLTDEFAVKPGETVVRTLDLPSGPSRTFTVEAFDPLLALLYRGQATVDLAADKPQTVLIDMLHAAGSPDFGFGAGGTARTPIGSSFSDGYAVAVQSDGKIVVAGAASNGRDNDFAVARYNADGTLDTSGFGGGTGIVTTGVGPGNDQIHAVTIDGNGKIVAAGYASNGADLDFALVRYNSDGGLDANFGGGTGKVLTPVGSSRDIANAVAVDGNGMIVAAGLADTINSTAFAVARYNAAGTLDTTFGGGSGIVTTSIGGSFDVIGGIAIQPDNKIAAGGVAFRGGSVGYDFALARYNTDGTLDAGFGPADNGWSVTDFNKTEDQIRAIALQPDGKIVAVGFTDGGASGHDFALARYDANGSLDASFGNGGLASTPFGNLSDQAYGVVLQPDDKIVVAGYTDSGIVSLSDHNFALARYHPDGSPDPGFGEGGKAVSFLTVVDDEARGVALQSDGKIVAAGFSLNATTFVDEFAVVRYWP
jgi:uncharacterized delta-60 repeat protein